MRLALPVAFLLALACDPPPASVDAGPPQDAGPVVVDAGPQGEDAGPVDAGESGPAHCLAPDLILEAIEIGVSITLFNPTSEAVVMDERNFFLCRRPAYPELSVLEPGVVIEPGGRHVYAWPSNSMFAVDASAGEIGLYRSPSFENGGALLDFVCWGAGIDPGRKGVAESAGDWSGDCAPALAGTVIRRLADTDGLGAASYGEAGAELSCP